MDRFHEIFCADKLDLVIRSEDAVIFHGDTICQTKNGNDLCHPNQRLLKHVITDLQFAERKNDEQITSLKLLEALVDGRKKKTDKPSINFANLMENDHFILLKKGILNRNSENDLHHPEFISQIPVVNLRFWSNSSIIQALNQFIAEEMNHFENEGNSADPLGLLLQQAYFHCSDEEKISLHLLSDIHHSGFVLPLLFVLGKITSPEYAKGLFSMKINTIDPKDWNNSLESILYDAWVVKDFLSFFNLQDGPDHRVTNYIKDGEGDLLEFKSTLRWDLKAGKTNQAIERACLKTIAAFLNTLGGTLLIGVRDNGSIEGIESDKFVNEDKFLLHLWTLIRTCLGRDVSPYLRSSLEKIEDHTVCIVQCSPCNRPVFLRQPGFNEEFYIRVGPGSTALDVSEALKYIADHFPAV